MDDFRKIARVLRTPVTLILLLCIVGYGASWGYNKATETIPPRPPTPCTPFDVGPELTSKWVQARVFNGGTVGGRAKTTATYLRAYGFNVIKINNATETVTGTVIVGNAADSPEVQLLMAYFKDATARGDGRVDHVVDVIISDESSLTYPEGVSIPVSGPVCLPANTKLPTATPTAPTPAPSPTQS